MDLTRSPRSLARRLAADVACWQGRIRHHPAERAAVRLLATDDVEAWLLGWYPRQGIELHDHGGSSGALVVVEGELVEHSTGLGRTGPLRRTHLSVGSSLSFGPGHVHDVRNEAGPLATSIHVYSPPLTTMTFYDRWPGSAPVATRTELVEGVEPAHALTTV